MIALPTKKRVKTFSKSRAIIGVCLGKFLVCWGGYTIMTTFCLNFRIVTSAISSLMNWELSSFHMIQTHEAGMAWRAGQQADQRWRLRLKGEWPGPRGDDRWAMKKTLVVSVVYGGYTTLCYRIWYIPLWESLLNSQDSMESNTVFFRCSGGFFGPWIFGETQVIQVVQKTAGDCELRGSDRWLFLGGFYFDLTPQDGNKHGGTTVLDEGLFWELKRNLKWTSLYIEAYRSTWVGSILEYFRVVVVPIWFLRHNTFYPRRSQKTRVKHVVISSDCLLFLAVLGEAGSFQLLNSMMFPCVLQRKLLWFQPRKRKHFHALQSDAPFLIKPLGIGHLQLRNNGVGIADIAAMSYRPLSLSDQESQPLKKDDEASRAGRINGDENTWSEQNPTYPCKHTPDPQPTVYEGIWRHFGGLGMPGVCSKGMLEFSRNDWTHEQERKREEMKAEAARIQEKAQGDRIGQLLFNLLQTRP